MKTSSLLMATTLLVAQSLASSAQAAAINGSINFSPGGSGGIIFQDSGGNVTSSIGSAAGIQSWVQAEVDGGTGSFASVASGTPVTFTAPWIFNPSTPTLPLWSIGGPEDFTFYLTASSVAFQNSAFLGVKGTGYLTGNGFDTTNGSWTFSTQGQGINGVFTWSSTTVATGVPDTGTTFALFGGTLLGICGLHRKFRRR